MKKLLMMSLTLALFTAQAQEKRTVFFEKDGMNPSVRPQDNFFEYANGKWVKDTKIPSDQRSWGSFTTLYDGNQKKIRTILDDLSAQKNLTKNSLEQKVGDFFVAVLDTVAIEKRGFQPVQSKLNQIAAVKNYRELLDFIAADVPEGGGAFIGLYVGADEKNSNKNILNFFQAGTNLPEKDYYLVDNADNQRIRAAYLVYIAKLFTLSGTPEAVAKKQANDILALETKIAASHLAPAELRDPVKNYNKMPVAELAKMAPNLEWKKLLSLMKLSTDSINVSQPNYYKTLSQLLVSEPIEVWKNKVRFEYLADNAGLLSKPFRDASFEFNGKTLGGQPAQPPRWKQAVSSTNRNLGELLGQVYVKKYFSPKAKKRMDELVNNLQIAFKARLEKLDWMSQTTKDKALLKLSTITKKIGYPDKWKNYDDVTVSRNAYFENVKSAARHNFREQVEKLDKKVDKTEWGMTPPTVNAYYNPSFNEIVFPAGILQFPFFDENADDAINYGGIGMVIGHEITHGFDDQGRQYDAMGNLQDWWQKEDAEKFKKQAGNLVKQYNSFMVLDSLHVKGELTLGENLADLGGLSIAYDAFQLTPQAKSAEKTDGFMPEQRFFLGFAQVWRTKDRPELMRLLINTDPHSPSTHRVNGPLSNFPPFYKAFDVKPGDKLYRPDVERVVIW
jgi:putative endopeptidase